jgi:hypothetical protein
MRFYNLISFDDAPENVRKLASAIMESLGPTGIPEISPKAALIFGKNVGLDSISYVAAIRWLAKYYKSRVGEGSIVNSRMAKSLAKHFEAFAVALEEEASRANAEALCVTTT